MNNLPFKIDKRFEQCTRDMIITFVFLAAYAFFILSVSYGLGGKPMSEYTFYLGMPSWFFICVVGVVLFILALAFICFRVFAEMSIEAYIEQESENNG